MRSIVLLRGINVGGRRPIVMGDLRTWLQDSGLHDVRTYIHSGNAVVEHAATTHVAGVVHDAIERASGLDVPVIVRTATEFTSVLAASPFKEGTLAHWHVAFLEHPPEAAALLATHQRDWQQEEFEVIGREVYLYLPDGLGRSAMVQRLALLKHATIRNWNTVQALGKMADPDFRD